MCLLCLVLLLPLPCYMQVTTPDDMSVAEKFLDEVAAKAAAAAAAAAGADSDADSSSSSTVAAGAVPEVQRTW